MHDTPPGFFDRYPLFYSSGNTGRVPRLCARHEVLIGQNVDRIEGRRCLDIGSHDGRWTFAAIQAGAAHVVGVEPRAGLAASAERNLAAYSVPAARYAFAVADGRSYLRTAGRRFDTVFLFGVFYHVHDHVDLVRLVAETGADTVLLDTQLTQDANALAPTVTFTAEPIDDISNNPQELLPGSGCSIVGHPSRAFVHFLFDRFGYEVAELPWAPALARWTGRTLEDYHAGARGTFRITKRATS